MTLYELRPLRQKINWFNRIFYLGGSLATLALILIVSYCAQRPAIGLDGCPVNGVIPSIDVVLIDQSDNLEAPDAALAKRRIDEMIEGVPEGGRLSIYRLDPSVPAGARSVLALCAPQNANPQDFVQRLLGAPSKVRAQWNDNFRDKVDAAIASLSQPEPSPQSPIMGALFNIALEEFHGRAVPFKHLIIFSDFFEYTGDFNFYHGPIEWPQLAERIRAGRQLAELGGVGVEAHMLPRAGKMTRQNGAVMDFWEAYFNAAGVGSLNWRSP